MNVRTRTSAKVVRDQTCRGPLHMGVLREVLLCAQLLSRQLLRAIRSALQMPVQRTTDHGDTVRVSESSPQIHERSHLAAFVAMLTQRLIRSGLRFLRSPIFKPKVRLYSAATRSKLVQGHHQLQLDRTLIHLATLKQAAAARQHQRQPPLMRWTCHVQRAAT